MLVYLPTASEEIQNKAFEYANRLLSDRKQLELIPETAPCHALLGNPEGRPSTYQSLREMQVAEEAKTSYASHDFASVNSDGVVVGVMGYNTKNLNGSVFGYGPWLGQIERVGVTFERDMISIYDEAIKNTHETWVSLFCGDLNKARLETTFREKDGRDGWQRHVIGKYELKTLPLTMVYTNLLGEVMPTRSAILRGKLK